MKVIVNGIPLLSPRSGVGNYVYHNFQALMALDSGWDCSFFYGLQLSPRLKKRPVEPYVSLRKLVKRIGNAYPFYRNSLDLFFKVGQRLNHYDLYHETNYVPMNFEGPILVTVFDLSCYLHPETHPISRVRYMEKYFYPRLGRASHFITISESIKLEMVRHLGLPKDKITVTPIGVDELFRPVPREQLDPIIGKYGLKAGGYLLYVGTLEPRKNIGTLLEAYAKLPAAMRESYPLVLAGGKGWLMDDLSGRIHRLGIAGTTRLTGYIPKDHLPALYAGAAIFIYPSLYEGFGLPVLEAMACGAPVITSNASSLPEVVGDDGVLVDPANPDQLRDSILHLIESPSDRSRLRLRGMERSRLFTWENCAKRTVESYQALLRKTSG